MLSSKNIVEGYLNQSDWRVKENSNSHFLYGGLQKHVEAEVFKDYWLRHVYPEKISKAYINGNMHIHDLGGLTLYCCGYSLEKIISMGIEGISNIPTSAFAKHFDAMLNQIANIITVYQSEIMGAVAFSSFDTLLAPFVKEDQLTYKQVKQHMQNFIFSINSNNRGGCVPETTEVLTPNGFKKHNELTIGDDIYTYKNGELNINKINKLNVFNYEGDLISFLGRDYNQTVTPNHRVLRRDFNADSYQIQYAEELLNFKTRLCFPVSLENTRNDYDISDEMLKLMTFILATGIIKKNGGIKIYRSWKQWINRELIDILKKLNIRYSTRIHDSKSKIEKLNRKYKTRSYVICKHDREDILIDITTKNSMFEYFKKLSKRQAQLVINTWWKLDGNKNHLFCDNMDTANHLQHLCFLAGYSSHTTTESLAVRANKIIISYYTRKIKNTNEIKLVKYNGIVWCPTTDDGIVVFRENGRVFISGNSEPAFTNLTFDITPSKNLLHSKASYNNTKHYTYKDCQKEMDMINRAFYELMISGDAKGEPFAYPLPTYNIHDRFDWDNPNNELLWKMAGKFGYPYFANFINSDLDMEDTKSMCCRLSLNLKELEKRGGGLFGSESGTGSIGVVTVNLPQLAYNNKSNKTGFYKDLTNILNLAKESLEIKRNFLNANILGTNLIPAFNTYVGTLKNHFSTIGIIGMNEMCENFLGENILSNAGREFAIEVGNFIRNKLIEFQEETGNLFNYEATPAESTCYRLAKKDKEKFKDIITAGDNESPYYTNSCHIPVNSIESLQQIFEHQDNLQTQFTGGTVVHLYTGCSIDGNITKSIIKTACENYKSPYIDVCPLNRYCPDHGYTDEVLDNCPICGKELNKYQKITGYLRNTKHFNDGKKAEFNERRQLFT